MFGNSKKKYDRDIWDRNEAKKYEFNKNITYGLVLYSEHIR